MLQKFDANHNGTIDPEEREAMKAQREARRAEMLKKYDTDGDGKLSDSEREALRKDMREQHEQKHQEPEHEKSLASARNGPRYPSVITGRRSRPLVRTPLRCLLAPRA